jgi:hypothetical protein
MKVFSIQYGEVIEAKVTNGRIGGIVIPMPEKSTLMVSCIEHKKNRIKMVIYDCLSVGEETITNKPIKERLAELMKFAKCKTKPTLPLVCGFSKKVGVAKQTKEAGFKKSLTGMNVNSKSDGILIKDDEDTQIGWRVTGMNLESINSELTFKERTPVEGEVDKMKSYVPIIKHFIKSMGKSWKTCKTNDWISSSFPYSFNDLMQIGMTETIIAIRKYNNSFDASESTFVFEHLSRNFAQIRRNFGVEKRGYNVATVELPSNI